MPEGFDGGKPASTGPDVAHFRTGVQISQHNYGKMRCQSQKDGGIRYYRCRSRELGYTCDQAGVSVEKIDDQVVSILMQLKPPADWRKRITAAMGEMLGEQSIEQRLAEINATIERMDFRWDHGLILDQTEYLEKRLKLQQELESLTPIPEDDLERAADLLVNFKEHWKACVDDAEAQYKLVKLIVKRVYVSGEEVVAMTLRSDYHIVLGHKLNGPTEVPVDPYVYTSGSDGIRTRLVKLFWVSISPSKLAYPSTVQLCGVPLVMVVYCFIPNSSFLPSIHVESL